MKKKIHILSLLLCFSLLTPVLFSSCDHDTNCYLDVIVLDEATHAPVPNAKVEIYKDNCDESDYNYSTGITNSQGLYSTYYVAPAILSIHVSLNLDNGGQRQGNGTVRLLEGETITREVYLGTDLHF